MRKVQYAWYYNRTGLVGSLGQLDPYPLYHEKRLPHPHEVYLASNGDIKRCDFENMDTHAVAPITDISENIYVPRDFQRIGKPASWPKNCDYPFDPQWGSAFNGEPWTKCDYCDKYIVRDSAYSKSYKEICATAPKKTGCSMLPLSSSRNTPTTA